MSKIKRTPVPFPGTTPKPTAMPIRAPSKQPLSQETIGNSDDSEVETAPKMKVTKKPEKTKEKTMIGVHKPKTNGVSKKSTQAAPKPPPAREKIVKPVPTQGTSSSSEESDEDSVESEVNAHSSAIRENAGRVDESASVSDSTSESESSSHESDEEPAPTPRNKATLTYVRHKTIISKPYYSEDSLLF